jgi:hypothetical protein
MLTTVEKSADSSDRWIATLQEINVMESKTNLMPLCVAILRTDWDRKDPSGYLKKSPAEVENFLRSFFVRNFAFSDHSVGVRKNLCQILDAFKIAALKRR